jgi:hypothetical protein
MERIFILGVLSLSLLANVVSARRLSITRGNDQPISDALCCVPDQWDARLFMDYGTVFIDASAHPNTAYSYINGTLHMSYDHTNERSYINAEVIEVSPLIPKPIKETTTFIYDFKKVCIHTHVDRIRHLV